MTGARTLSPENRLVPQIRVILSFSRQDVFVAVSATLHATTGFYQIRAPVTCGPIPVFLEGQLLIERTTSAVSRRDRKTNTGTSDP